MSPRQQTRQTAASDVGEDVAMSTGAVALRLGVAATTLRSWERRYAIGPAGHVDGKHRRWLPDDIARLEEMCRLTSLGVPPAEAARAARTSGPQPSSTPRHEHLPARSPGGRRALPLGRARTECRGLARAALRLDAEAVEHLLARSLDEYGCVLAWEEIIAPTLQAVGRKWNTAGERYIEVEHLLSWLVSSALRSARRVKPRPGDPPVLLACAPDELHSLPLEALWAALGERALAARMLGPAVPADVLKEAVRRVGPPVVVVWAQGRPARPADIVSAVEGVEWGLRGARSHSTLLVAGPGWSGVPEAGSRSLTGLRSAAELIAQRLTR